MKSSKIQFDLVEGSRRLRSLRETRKGKKVSYDTLADDTGINKQSLKNYERAGELGIDGIQYSTRGDAFAGMSANNLVTLAQYFDVSTDYLLGLTDVETPDTDTRAVNGYTGLSERAIELLHSSTGEFAFVTAINRILESGTSGISLLLSIEDYLNTDESARYDMTKYHDEFTATDSVSANTIQLLEIQERLRKIKGGLK